MHEPTEAFVIGRVRGFHDELKAGLISKEAGLSSGEELFGAAIFHGIDRERRRRPLGEDGGRLPKIDGVGGAVFQSRVKSARSRRRRRRMMNRIAARVAGGGGTR